jgi:Lrp/AsnC family transcriptional regulator for asnA, asnC and gidA
MVGVYIVRLDEKDLKLLEILRKNSRESYSRIAKELGMSDVAVINRIKKLEKNGVIKKYTIEIDPSKMGFNSVSLTGIDTEPESLFIIIDKLKPKPYVKKIYITSGDHSLMTEIWARDGSELARIHEEISSLPGVKRVCPSIILEAVKE